jgi:hypothetical protein
MVVKTIRTSFFAEISLIKLSVEVKLVLCVQAFPLINSKIRERLVYQGVENL